MPNSGQAKNALTRFSKESTFRVPYQFIISRNAPTVLNWQIGTRSMVVERDYVCLFDRGWGWAVHMQSREATVYWMKCAPRLYSHKIRQWGSFLQGCGCVYLCFRIKLQWTNMKNMKFFCLIHNFVLSLPLHWLFSLLDHCCSLSLTVSLNHCSRKEGPT